MSDLIIKAFSLVIIILFLYMYFHFLFFRKFVIDHFIRDQIVGYLRLDKSELQKVESHVYGHSGYFWKGLNIYTSFPSAGAPPFFLLPFVLIQIDGDDDVYDYVGSHHGLDVAVLKNGKFLYGKGRYNSERGEVGVMKGPDIGRIFIYRLGFFTWKKDVKHILQRWMKLQELQGQSL